MCGVPELPPPMTGSVSETDEASRWPPAFGGGVWPPLAFVAAFSVWVLVSNVLFSWLVGSDPSRAAKALWNIPSGLVQVSLAVLALRYEGVRLRDLGLGREQLGPALVAVGGFLVAVNAAVAGLLVLDGGHLSLEPFGFYRSAPLEFSTGALVASGVAQYIFVGPVEELAFRGYLQNKLTTLFGSGSVRLRTALAVVGTAAVFSLTHIPTLVLADGAQPAQAGGTLVLLALSGITFGAVYALTHNLLLVAFLHGVGNFWPLVVDPGAGAWPNWGVIIVLYSVVVVVYRWWTPSSLRSPGQAVADA